MNYLAPGTSYDEWVKAYGCKLTKSWFPYEWFDSPDKLTYPDLHGIHDRKRRTYWRCKNGGHVSVSSTTEVW